MFTKFVISQDDECDTYNAVSSEAAAARLRIARRCVCRMVQEKL